MIPMGTRSLLWGAHQFLIHPLFVALAWWRLYGFPWDPRLWVAFFVHDLGYWGMPNMDGPEGEEHPRLGAALMHAFFDLPGPWIRQSGIVLAVRPEDLITNLPEREVRILEFIPRRADKTAFCVWLERKKFWRWYEFTLYHSRFMARRDGRPHSRLCVADKLATCLTPWWLYLPMVNLSGEIHEYMERAGGQPGSKYEGEPTWAELERLRATPGQRAWFKRMTTFVRAWVEEHRDGKQDTWTPAGSQEVRR